MQKIRSNQYEKQKKLVANFDWVQCRIDNSTPNAIMNFLNLPVELWDKTVGSLSGYTCFTDVFECQHIKLFTGIESAKNVNMLIISGEACRFIESKLFSSSFLDWRDFLKSFMIAFHSLEWRRIDLNIDDLNDIPYFRPDTLLSYCEVRPHRFRYGRSSSYSVQGSLMQGMTLYIGARTSDRQIRVYDKKAERKAKEKIKNDELKSWIRLEVQFMREISGKKILEYITQDLDLIDLIKGYLNANLKFYDDDNLTVIPKFWTNYLMTTNTTKVKISHVNRELENSLDWFMNGGGLAVLKAYLLLADNDLLPEPTELEYADYSDTQDIDKLIDLKGFPLDLSQKLQNYVLKKSGDLDLVNDIKNQTYDPKKETKTFIKNQKQRRKVVKQNGKCKDKKN